MDSCCFIDLAKAKVGQELPSGRDKDLWFLRKLLEAAGAGAVDVYVSTLTIANALLPVETSGTT